MKLNAHFVACVAALVVAACTPSLGRAQALMMGADGAIHLDDQAGAVGSQPIIINESPEIIQTPGVQPWTGGGQPMMTTPYGMYSPQCMSCGPMAMQTPQANLGPCQRLMKDGGLQWVAGAEFLYARASFSNAVAYVSTDDALNNFNFAPIDFDYNPSYSIYGGAFVSQWGGAMIIDFTRLSSDANFGALTTETTPIAFPFDADVSGSADVDAKTYDLSFSKSLYLGGAASGATAGCPTCVAGRPAWEPAWELGFEGGMRYAEVEWSRTANATAAPDPEDVGDSTRSELNFDGFGPRLGVLGRRYIGKRGFLSVYAKGDWSLLWGDVDQRLTLTDGPTGTVSMFSSGGDRIIPITEIELGATANVGRSASLSAGYFWMAWHDLGMKEVFDTSLIFAGDSGANILGFDGLFVRGEVAY